MKTLNKNKKTLECLKIYDNNNTNSIPINLSKGSLGSFTTT